MSKLTEIMKQIPLDELTGDVDMKERNTNIKVTTGGGAAVKRTGAFVAAAACAIAAVGGAVAYKKLSKSEPGSEISATDINSAAEKEHSETYKKNYEAYKMIFADEISKGADFDAVMKNVDVLESSENCTFTLDGIGGEYRVIGTRQSGDVLRVDIAGSGLPAQPDGRYQFYTESARLWDSSADTSTDSSCDSGSLWSQVYSEDGTQTAFSITFSSSATRFFAKSGSGEYVLRLDLSCYLDDGADGKKTYQLQDIRFPIAKHSFVNSLEPNVTVELPASGAYPGAKITLEKIEYSDLGLKAIIDSEWGKDKLDSNWFRSDADGISGSNGVLIAEMGGTDTYLYLMHSRGTDFAPWYANDTDDGKIVAVCDFADSPIDASKITAFTFDDVRIAVNGSAAPENTDSTASAKETYKNMIYGGSAEKAALAESFTNYADQTFEATASYSLTDKITVIGTRRFGQNLIIDAVYDLNDQISDDLTVFLTAPDGTEQNGIFMNAKDGVLSVSFFIDKDYSFYSNNMTVRYEGIFGNGSEDAEILLPAAYACKKGEGHYTLDGKLLISHSADGKELSCHIEGVSLGNGCLGLDIIAYDDNKIIGIGSETLDIFKSGSAPFCTAVFSDGSTRVLEINSTSAPKAYDGTTKVTLYSCIPDSPMDAAKLEKLVFSDGTELTAEMITAAQTKPIEPGTKDIDGFLAVNDTNRLNGSFEPASQLPVKGEWMTQYQGVDQSAAFEVSSLNVEDGKLTAEIDFISDCCRYLEGNVDENGIDKKRQSAAFYLPYCKSGSAEFLNIVTADGSVLPTETRIISTQLLDCDGLVLTTELSDKIPAEQIKAIRLGSAEIPVKAK